VVLAGFGTAVFAAERALGRRFVRVCHLRDARVAVLFLQDAIADRTPNVAGLRHNFSPFKTIDLLGAYSIRT